MSAAPATSPQARRAGLDREDVVAAATALVEAEGPEALTMRKLAAELGVTTTTIYWHVGGREELVAAVVARHAEQQVAAVPVRGRTPQARIEAVAAQLWRSSLEHPNLAALAHQAGATAVLRQPAQEAIERELAAAGVTGAEARDAVTAIVLCVAGFLVAGIGRPSAHLDKLFRRTLGAVVREYLPKEPVA